MRHPLKLVAASALLFIVFIVNLCIGKYRVWSSTDIQAPLDGVPEFIILLVAVALFIAVALSAERQKKARSADE